MRSRRSVPYLWGAVSVLILGLALLGPGSSTPVAAETVSVAIRDFAFSPATISVPVGTTVTWTNEDSEQHTATSTSGVWDSGILDTGGTFSFTFNTPGSFPYWCALHPSMRGTVVVTAAATPTPTGMSAPTLTGPAEGAILTSFGPALTWTNPPGATQYHLQVIPANNDGPGVDVHIGSPAGSFQVPPPPQWYGLLPNMTYTWRGRVSDASSFVDLTDTSWSLWTERRFRTPTVSSTTISSVSPANDAVVTLATPTLQWANSRSDVFYYEVQLSKDRTFNTDPATATAMVYWELRHGGATTPPNSYTVPAAFPLEANSTYFWRVRPRVQGDGTPVEWSTPVRFFTGPSGNLTPTSTPIPSSEQHPSSTATSTPIAPTPTPTPSQLGDYQLAFVSTRDGNAEIYAMQGDGSGQVNRTKNVGSDLAPVWSPNGRYIAFETVRPSLTEVFVMDADGRNPHYLSDQYFNELPSWSWDGSRVAWASNGGSADAERTGFNIFSAWVDRSRFTQHTTSGADETRPAWSPDGKKIAFESKYSGSKREIYLWQEGVAANLNLTANSGDDHWPVWSPKGDKIAFVSDRDGNPEIYVMDARGNNQKNLTQNSSLDDTPTWSPDGTRVMLVSRRDKNQEIYVMNADGSDRRNLTNSANNDHSPAWSPDGRFIAFVSDRDGNTEIYVMKADGTNPRNLTNNSASDIAPSWRPVVTGP